MNLKNYLYIICTVYILILRRLTCHGTACCLRHLSFNRQIFAQVLRAQRHWQEALHKLHQARAEGWKPCFFMVDLQMVSNTCCMFVTNVVYLVQEDCAFKYFLIFYMYTYYISADGCRFFNRELVSLMFLLYA